MVKRIVAVLGDFYHKKEPIQLSLESAVSLLKSKLEVDVELVVIEAADLQDQLWAAPELVVLYKENRVVPDVSADVVWMGDEIASSIARYVEEGGSWLAWHSGFASYPEDGIYTDMVGGYFEWHPAPHNPVRYLKSESDHSIVTDFQTYEVPDEHYFVHTDPDNVDVFLYSESIEGNSVAGWTKAYGRGHVCCLAPTHLPMGLENAEFIRLLKSVLEWCLSAK